jgi:hypothetical protein
MIAWPPPGRALSSDRPMVPEVKTDPEVAPLPTVTFKQARGFMSAMSKGDGGTGGIIVEAAKQSSKDFRQKNERLAVTLPQRFQG